jgi:hypothetical protein
MVFSGPLICNILSLALGLLSNNEKKIDTLRKINVKNPE